MFRPRFRSLKPREIRSIRHWAIELVVVVVGVLLALWTAEWAADRREAKIRADAMEKVDSAIEESLVTFAHYAAAKPCIEGQRDALLAQLRESGGQWRGVSASNQRDGLSSDVAFSYPFLPLAMPFSTEAFDRARAIGAFEALDREQAEAYFAVETQLTFAESFAEVFRESFSTFAPLGVDREVTQDQRFELEQELAKADMALDAMEVTGIFIRRYLRTIDWKLSEKVRKDAEEQVGYRIEQYGGCAVDVDPFPEEESFSER